MPNQLKTRRTKTAAVTGVMRGAVLFEGNPVPHDIVRVEPDSKAWAGRDPFGGNKPRPGPSQREFMSVTGEFEAAGLEPGNYSVSARFQFGSQAALPTKTLAHRVTINEEGKMEVYDSAGKLVDVLSKALGLVVAPETPSKGLAMGCFRGTINFLDAPAGDLNETPIFITAREVRGRSKWVAAIRGPIKNSSASFELPVPAGYNYILQLQSVHWAPVACVPQTDQIEVGKEPVELSISVVKAGGVHVRILRPDGGRYTPVFEGGITDCSGHHYVDMRLMPDAMCFDRLVNPDGTIDLVGVPPGIYTGEFFPRGDAFEWFVPGLPGIRVESGKTTEVELKFSAGSPVAIEPAASPLRPLKEQKASEVGVYDGRERWVRPLPGGTVLDRDAACKLFIREQHGRFQFKQDAKGAWHAPQASAAGATAAKAGLYDVYLLETSLGWGPSHYLRLLSNQTGFEVGSKARRGISFKESPLCWGASSFAGEITEVPLVSEKDAADIDGDFLKFISRRPTITVRGAGGRPVAFAWAQPSKLRDDTGFSLLISALATNDYKNLNKLLRASKYTYDIPDLPAGDYELELWAPGCASERKAVRLDGKGPCKINMKLRPGASK